MRPLRRVLRRIRDVRPVRRCLIGALIALRRFGYRPHRSLYRHVPYVGVVSLMVPEGRPFAMMSYGRKLENSLFWEGLEGHEPESLRLWIELARSARTVLDIGSHAGLYSLVAVAAGAARVHAFEPVERVRRLLIENIGLNEFGDVATGWPDCVSDAEGEVTLFDPGGESPGSATVSEAFASMHPVPSGYRTVRAATTTVDAFCSRTGATEIDLVKIDVEGHEAAVLRGMRRTVERWRPSILVEVLDEDDADFAAELTHLEGLGYSSRRIADGDGRDGNLLLRPA